MQKKFPLKFLLSFSVFIIITPITMVALALLLINPTIGKESYAYQIPENTERGVQIFASQPEKLPSVSSSVTPEDARPILIRKYLERYNSPLVGLETKLVEVSDSKGLDYRLLTAIAQQESNLCKRIPPETYNCWGWGIHSRGTLGFTNFEEGIETVSEGLKNEYIGKGLLTPEDIMKKYTPASNGSWAEGVSSFMEAIEN